MIWKDHCTPWLPDSEAQEVSIYKNGELLSQSTVVKIPFRAHGRDLDAQILYRDNGTSERAFATVAGSASILEKPMKILKGNARYQSIVENLEERGYTVKEESAQVVKAYIPADYASVPACIKDEVWNTAIINVKAVKGDQVKYIVSAVCIDKEKVLALWDAWWCYPACLAACAGGCYVLCLSWAPALCLYCAGGCDAFCTVYCH